MAAGLYGGRQPLPIRCVDDVRETPIDVAVVRVFTDDAGRFGNLLGIVDGSLSARRPAGIAARIGFSETVFVDDARSRGHLRIFTPAIELPFAGHPTVGTAWWLRRHGYDVRSSSYPPAPSVSPTRAT